MINFILYSFDIISPSQFVEFSVSLWLTFILNLNIGSLYKILDFSSNIFSLVLSFCLEIYFFVIVKYYDDNNDDDYGCVILHAA